MATKISYIELDIEFLDEEIKKLQEDLRSYERPLKPIVEWKKLNNGGMLPLIIASKEDQMKAIAFILEKLPKMIASKQELMEREERKKKELRKGFENVNDLLED